jgi:hypothetical protein
MLVMPGGIFNGPHPQPEPCRFMQEVICAVRLFVTNDQRAVARRLPLRPQGAVK